MLIPRFWLSQKIAKLLDRSRVCLNALIGLVTDDCKLRHRMNRIDLTQDTEFRPCMEDDEKAEHVLCTSPAGTRIRYSVFGSSFGRRGLSQIVSVIVRF